MNDVIVNIPHKKNKTHYDKIKPKEKDKIKNKTYFALGAKLESPKDKSTDRWTSEERAKAPKELN